jgi:hypothetical protein
MGRFGNPDIHIEPHKLPVFSSLFLYGHYGEDHQFTHTFAAVGRITEGYFTVARTFPVDYFGKWYRVWSAARGGDRWLLFIGAGGTGATGLINDELDFVQARSFPEGYLTDWEDAAVDGEGFLLLVGLTAGQPKIALAQVESDGNLIIWWKTESALGLPEQLIGLPNAHAWFVSNPDTGTTTLHILHRGQLASSRTWPQLYTGIAAHGDLIALYRGPFVTEKVASRPRCEVCRVGADYQVVTVSVQENDPFGWGPKEFDWGDGVDVDTPNGILFYELVTGRHRAQVRSLTASGYVTTKDVGLLVPTARPGAHVTSDLWYQSIAPC